jgi:uncharacterized membrane protein YdjX (TVP38/TMEM64 family)
MNKKILYIKSAFLILIFAACCYFTIHYKLWILLTDREKLLAFVNSFDTLSVEIFIGLQIIQVVIAAIPGEVTGLIGGYLYGAFWGTIYSTIGLSLGSVVAFYFARTLGRPFVLIFVNHKYLEKFDYLMSHKGTSISALLFLVPGFPKDYLCYILGLSKMTPRVFIIIATFGRVISTAMLSVGGDLLRDESYKTFSLLAAVVLLIMLLVYIYRDPIEKKLRHMIHKDQ